MYFVVMGCGRTGASTARALEDRGHTVAIIDQNPAAFRRLPTDFSGRKITGVGFDRDTLAEAGIAEAYGFAALSDGDNSNILAARVVREEFAVANTVARIYDPDRAEVFQRLGISTVATVPWAADQVLRAILPAGAAGEYQDPSGQLTLARFDIDSEWIGVRLTAIEEATGGRVAFITRFGEARLPLPDAVFQSGDLVHLFVPSGDLNAVERLLARPPERNT